MGIRGLLKQLAEAGCIKQIPFKNLQDECIVVDANSLLWKLIPGKDKYAKEPYRNAQGKNNTYIVSLWSKIVEYSRNKNRLLFVIDGNKTSYKMATYKKRQKARKRAEKNYHESRLELKEDTKERKYLSNNSNEDLMKNTIQPKMCIVGKEELTEICDLLNASGQTSITAVAEADSQIGLMLSENKNLNYALTYDTDILLLFSNKVVDSGCAKNKFIIFNLQEKNGYNNGKILGAVSPDDVLEFFMNKANMILERLQKQSDDGMSVNKFESKIYQQTGIKQYTRKTFGYMNVKKFCAVRGNDFWKGVVTKNYTSDELFEDLVIVNFNMSQYVNLLSMKSTKWEQEHKDIIGILNPYLLPSDFLDQWEKICKYYNHEVEDTNKLVGYSDYLQRPNNDKIIEIMCQKNWFEESDISEGIRYVEDFYNYYTECHCSQLQSTQVNTPSIRQSNDVQPDSTEFEHRFSPEKINELRNYRSSYTKAPDMKYDDTRFSNFRKKIGCKRDYFFNQTYV